MRRYSNFEMNTEHIYHIALSSTKLNTEHLWCSIHRRELARVMNVPEQGVQVSKCEEIFRGHSIYNLLQEIDSCVLGTFKLLCFIVCLSLANKV